jgi:PTS system nitrogen regulatory IIA component
MKTQSDVSIGSLLNKDNTFIFPNPGSKTEIIKTLVQTACKDLSDIDIEDVRGQVLRRESGISTTLDTGLSIPHCRVAEIESFRAACAVFPGGLKDPENPDLEIKVMFLFLSPSNPAFFQKHLEILAELSEKFKDSFINKLTACKTAEEALAVIKSLK